MVGYSLKIYDCYRPQRAVDDFVAWQNNSFDTIAKTEFYSTLNKVWIWQFNPDLLIYIQLAYNSRICFLAISPTNQDTQEALLLIWPSCPYPLTIRNKKSQYHEYTKFDPLFEEEKIEFFTLIYLFYPYIYV